MMKKLTRTRILSLVVVAGLLCGTAFAASAVTTKMIEANYMGIRIVVDGKEITPTDANGNVVEPFASGGTTYLPVRAIGEALGKEVTWDGDTATVYVGQVPGQADSWMKLLPPYEINKWSAIYDGSDPKAFMTVSGKDITEGVLLQDRSGVSTTASYALWNTDLKYSTMTFTVGHVDGTEADDATLEVYLDGELSTSYDLKWDGAPQTISVPLNRAANVKLLVVKSIFHSQAGYGVYDISFS